MITKAQIIKYLSPSISFGLLICVIGLMPSCSCIPRASIIIAGSTSVQPFAEVLAEAYMTLHPDVTIDIQGGGSAAGIMAAQTGTANIGMSSRSLTEQEKSLWSVEIARDGLAIIVHPDNPIINLTLNQVRDIYSGAITSWSSFGGRNTKIHVITREDGSGTRSAFESLVMGGIQITPRAIVQNSNGAVRQLVAGDRDAIGFMSLGLVDNTVKAVELEGIVASRENIVNGSYGLSRPFLFLARSQPSGIVKDFIDFTLSADGERILEAEGLITSLEGPIT
jgi:phosphate transport system substrate-binding protein